MRHISVELTFIEGGKKKGLHVVTGLSIHTFELQKGLETKLA